MSALRRYATKPWVVMPLVALLGLGGWYLFRPDHGSASSTPATTEQVVAATTGTMAQTLTATGTIAAAQTDDLSFSSAGTVTAVNVTAGQQVKQGQVLATIDSAQLASTVVAAQSQVASAEATLADHQAAGASSTQLAADQADLTSAQDQLTSAQDALSGAKLVATFDGTVSQVNLTVGEQLSSSGSGGTAATGSGSGSGRSSSTLGSGSSSPFGQGSNSTSSSSSSPQIEVVSTSSFTVPLGIDDTQIGEVKVGQPATVTLSTSTGFGGFGGGRFPGFAAFARGGGFAGALGGGQGSGSGSSGSGSSGSGGTAQAAPSSASATGTVTEVGKVAEASSGVATYPVTVAFHDTTGQFHVGATASVAITYAQVADAIEVPSLAVSTSNGTSTVVVDSDGKHATREVTTGLTEGGMTQITQGLRAGEQVVVTLPNLPFLNRAGTGGGTGRGSGAAAGGAFGR